MTEDKKTLLTVLKTFRAELLKLAESLKTNVLKVSDLNGIFIFKILDAKEKEVINQLVGEAVGNSDKLNTGQDSLSPSFVAQSLEDSTGEAKGRSYAASQFRSNDDRAA